ncbi:protein pyrabcn [Lasius niger]|uniref:Protein pyrabcn n=1 Tax=Lasius niger TaxID=67767 RepID=A0A0J7JWJ1_LASNI|nr:protein pyrabcn [Lasius niger]
MMAKLMPVITEIPRNTTMGFSIKLEAAQNTPPSTIPKPSTGPHQPAAIHNSANKAMWTPTDKVPRNANPTSTCPNIEGVGRAPRGICTRPGPPLQSWA